MDENYGRNNWSTIRSSSTRHRSMYLSVDVIEPPLKRQFQDQVLERVRAVVEKHLEWPVSELEGQAKLLNAIIALHITELILRLSIQL